MSSNYKIQYLSRQEIDIEKWNNCIAKAANGLIYSYSFYLDAVCDNWHALVVNSYDAVLPLPWRKKAGIRYLYAPPFVQQLGITGKYDESICLQVLNEVEKNFKYGDLFFNYGNANLPVPFSEKTNFILPLTAPYEELAAQFSNHLKRNLNVASKVDFQISDEYAHATILKLFQETYGDRIPHVTASDYQRFISLCDILAKKKLLLTKTVTNNKAGFLATALLLKDNKRIYNLINLSTLEGRKSRANHFLLAQLIKEFSETDLIFDFEGSDLPGVKEFYQNFRPVNQSFFHYHFNNLPFPLNLIKK